MLLVTSIHSIAPGDELNVGVVEVLAELAAEYPVGVVSNRSEPSWFSAVFGGTPVEFVTLPGRTDGKVLRGFAEGEKIPEHKVIVLAGSRDDIAMAKNAGAVLVGAGWAEDDYVRKTGLKVEKPEELTDLVRLVDGWVGEHWFRAKGMRYTVEAICDLSTWYADNAQKRFGRAVRDAVKDGGRALNGLLAVASCLLIHGGLRERSKLIWGVYPSSTSKNDDTEVLSEFTHRLRTSVSRVRMARAGKPLFVRHRPTVKRSASPGAVRTDPTSEVESIHLNPAYRSKIKGRDVVVLDDCTTHGISMATAAGFLRRAGARSIICLAVGKYGNRLGYYEVDIDRDPFAPVPPREWSCSVGSWDQQQEVMGAQVALRNLLGA